MVVTNRNYPKNKQTLEAYKQFATQEARNSLLHFTLYTNPLYETGWFNELLFAELEQFLVDAENGLMPRLMIFAPPRSGKSEAASRRFPAYVLGKHPHWNVIACSYSSDLANRMSRDTQRIIDSERYAEVFPDVRLNGTNIRTVAGGAIRTAELWETVKADGGLHGGAYRAAGVNGGITGQGMNIGIIDDPAKDYKTASSPVYQESVIDWYDTTFFTRADPKINGIIIILTRWHRNDLAGQLLKLAEEGGEQWRVVSFPMEAEKEEIHVLNGKTYNLRKPGEILFPERMPRDFVDKAKQRGSLVWNALYQQRPTAKGGGLIKSEWFGEYKILPPIRWSAVYGDTAQKTKEANDFSVFELWGLGEDGKLYLIDMIRGKWESKELKRRAVAFWVKCRARKDCGALVSMKVEDTAWEHVPDYRSQIAYHTQTHQSVEITEVGDIAAGLTLLAPQTPFDKWDGKQWVTDVAERQAHEIQQTESHKRELLWIAREKIDIYQDAIDLGMATEVEKTKLTAWRKYRVELYQVDCSTAPDVKWPEQPK